MSSSVISNVSFHSTSLFLYTLRNDIVIFGSNWPITSDKPIVSVKSYQHWLFSCVHGVAWVWRVVGNYHV